MSVKPKLEEDSKQTKLPFEITRQTCVYFPKMEDFQAQLDLEENLGFECKSAWAKQRVSRFIEVIQGMTRKKIVESVNEDGLITADYTWIRADVLISKANEVFGFNGWSTKIISYGEIIGVSLKERNPEVAIDDFWEQLKRDNEKKLGLIKKEEDDAVKLADFEEPKYVYNLTVKSVIELRLKDGTVVSSAGIANVAQPRKSAAFLLGKKQSATTAMKKCFGLFPELLKTPHERNLRLYDTSAQMGDGYQDIIDP